MNQTEILRHGSFGPIVQNTTTGEFRAADQHDMDTLPVGDDLTADEEETIDGD